MSKTVLITGGNRGIGKAIAKEYAKHKEKVIITYCNHEEEAKKLEREIEEKYDQKIQSYFLDLRKEEAIEQFYQKIEKESVDILINNAGIAIDTLLDDKTKQNFMKILEINLIGPFLLSQKLGKQMYQRKKGTIINIASTNGIDTPYVESLDYDASKAALISLTHNLARAYAPYIRVNAIAPGWVETDMNQLLDKKFRQQEENKILLNRFATPEEIAYLAYFLGREEASYINDSVIRIDGGIKR